MHEYDELQSLNMSFPALSNQATNQPTTPDTCLTPNSHHQPLQSHHIPEHHIFRQFKVLAAAGDL